ncbi:unnamed protein product, partial [Meganyctiphanes norvegica]
SFKSEYTPTQPRIQPHHTIKFIPTKCGRGSPNPIWLSGNVGRSQTTHHKDATGHVPFYSSPMQLCSCTGGEHSSPMQLCSCTGGEHCTRTGYKAHYASHKSKNPGGF